MVSRTTKSLVKTPERAIKDSQATLSASPQTNSSLLRHRQEEVSSKVSADDERAGINESIQIYMQRMSKISKPSSKLNSMILGQIKESRLKWIQ